MKKWSVTYVAAVVALASVTALETTSATEIVDAWELPAERTAMELGCKPCLALLPGGELILVALFQDRACSV